MKSTARLKVPRVIGFAADASGTFDTVDNEPDDDDVVGVPGFDITAAVVVNGVVGRPPAVTAPLVASVRSTRRPSCET